MIRSLVSLCISTLLGLGLYGCTQDGYNKQNASSQPDAQKNSGALQISEDKEIKDIRPVKPSRIKLHRNAKGEYTWDITSDNPDEVAKSDSRLRKLLKTVQ
jgi:hypothetical protein